MKKNETHHKGFAQKLLAISLCLSMLLLGIPRGQSARVEAAEEKLSLPDTAFITKDKLLKLCEETNVVDGKPTGLLATGKLKEDGGTDVKLRINFGQRPEAANYYNDFGSTKVTAASGPTTWLVAGSEKFKPESQTEETDGLVLYSEEPLVSAYDLRGDSKMNSKFQPTYTERMDGGTYWVGSGTTKTDRDDSDWGTYPDTTGDSIPDNPTNAYANHWGASNLRQVLNSIYNGSTLGEGDEAADYSGFFNATEKGLMSASTITTNDHQTGSAVEYTTQDVLYAPRLNSRSFRYLANASVTVGDGDAMTIDRFHWGGLAWLRSPVPAPSYYGLFTLPYYVLINDFVDLDQPSVTAAFRLNLSSVLFASAASVVSSSDGGKFEKISADTPMTLRLQAPEGSTAEVSATATEIVTKNAAGWTLMVQGVTSDGQNWSYSKTLARDDTVTGSDFASLPVAPVGVVWLEKPVEDGGSLAYATQPVAFKLPIETTVTVRDSQTQRIRLYDPHDVLPEDVTFSATYNEFHERNDFLIFVGSIVHFYDLTLTSGDKELSQLDAPVTLRFEAVNGIDAADAAVIRYADNTNLEVSRVTDENNTVWVEITTDHFSRYILVTGRRAARILLAGIATLLLLALGFTIRFIRKKKKN